MSECWRIGRLGTARLVTAHGGSLPLVRKDAVLLVYVGMNPGVSGSRVATLLWPDATERGALNNLRQRLHRLRKVSGARLLEVAETAMPAHDFSLSPMPDREALEADPDAWNGELLEGIAFDDADELSAWLAAERKAWADRRRDALAALASTCERAGELVRGLRYAQRLLVDDPLSEHVHRRLMRLHYLRGDRAAAVAAFEACERALKDEFGLRPSAETLELLQTIERSAAPARVATGPMPTTLLRPPRSVGRSAERTQLTRAHADGRVAALVGEAGMGKTRLLQDFIAAQPRAVYAQARPGDAAVPYGALARLLRAVLAAVPEAVDAAPRSELARVAPELAEGATAATPGQAPRLQAAIEHLLADALGRGVNTLVVDDLHFADPASVEMLRALVDADALADVRWAFAHRPTGLIDPNGALLQALADSPRACWIALAPLTDADLVELMEGLALPNVDPAAFAPALARHTGGNPLYVLETLREVHGLPPGSPSAAGFVLPRPQSIAHMIDRRLQRLSERALALARVAALAGADFSAELAEHALATPVLLLAGAWAELEAADVLRGTAFAHDLVRDGMLRATPPPIAIHAHRLIAQFLAGRSAGPATIAAHWLAGGEPARAATAFREAAQGALAAGRPREQAELLGRCARAFDEAGDSVGAMKAELDGVGPVLQSAGVDAALALVDRLLAQPAAPGLAGHAWSSRAMALMWGGRLADAEQAAQRALVLAAPEDDAVRVNAVCMLAAVRGQHGDPQAAVALLTPWTSRIDAIDDAETRVSFYGNLTAMLMQADRSTEALSAAQRHLALSTASSNRAEQVTALMNLSNLHGRRGDLAPAISAGEEAAMLIPETAQSTSLLAWNRISLGYWLAGDGRFAEGLANLEAALQEFGRPGGNPMLLSMAQDLCARVWLTLGQVARAHRLVDAAAEGSGRIRARQLYVRAKVRAALGHNDQALLLEAQSQVAEADPVRIAVEIDLAVRGPDTPMAARLDALQRLAQDHAYFALAAMAASLRATALVRSGRLAEAAMLLPDAERAALLSRGPHVYLPELMEHCAAAYTAVGAAADAQRCRAAALHWLHKQALPNVPQEFVDGFLQRNPVNLRLRAYLADRYASSQITGA